MTKINNTINLGWHKTNYFESW